MSTDRSHIDMVHFCCLAANKLIKEIADSGSDGVQLEDYAVNFLRYLQKDKTPLDFPTLWKVCTRENGGVRVAFNWPDHYSHDDYGSIGIKDNMNYIVEANRTFYFMPTLNEIEEFVSDLEDWLPAEVDAWVEEKNAKTVAQLEKQAALRFRREAVIERLKKL